jgi:polyphosphate kinase
MKADASPVPVKAQTASKSSQVKLEKPAKRQARPLPRTPASATEAPSPGPSGYDLSDPTLYLNRELTWLNFNYRVLHEAQDDRTPLLERVKFVSIVSSNLDEFFMKRIGGLKQQVGAKLHDLTVDGRTPRQQIDASCALIRELERRKRETFLAIIEELSDRKIVLTTYDKLNKKQQEALRQHYIENIYPLVTPQATDPAHPFPFISNLSLNLLVALSHPKDQTPALARVKVPVGIGTPRLLHVGSGTTFVPLESVMAGNLDLLFPSMDVESWALFRVTRNANTESEEDQADDLLAMIETELRERKFAPVVRLEVASDMSAYHRGMLAAELGLDEKADVFEVEGMLGLRDLMELKSQSKLSEKADLHDVAHHPLDHPALTPDRNIFHSIRDVGSILLHHPYDAFSTSVERFLKEASRDPKVRAIKMSLYRTSAKSNVIKHLIEAARNGKQVAVVMELKARFDEAANIRWANRLGEVGIHVTYGVVGLKTHSKLILVVRQDYNGLKRYAHVGTGNYHAGTARLYSDLGLMTCDPEIGRDLTELFNYLTTGYLPKRVYEKLLPAPKHLKPAILSRIRREIDGHSDSSPGLIQFKTNALEDADVTRALYEASQAGVKVDLLVRDSCRLRPGVPGLSENIRVIGIVGRFLEHARVYYFHNGGDEEYFIGSADLMKRNLQSRVEACAPVEGPALREDLRFLLDTQLADKRSAWEMQPDGSFVQLQPEEGGDARGSQQLLIERCERRYNEATRLRRRKIRGVKPGPGSSERGL